MVSKIILNPNLYYEYDDFSNSFRFRCPTINRGLIASSINPEIDKLIWKNFQVALLHKNFNDLPEKIKDIFYKAGIFVESKNAGKEVVFSCTPPNIQECVELPEFSDSVNKNFISNVQICPFGEFPKNIFFPKECFRRFKKTSHIVWIQHCRTQVFYPYWFNSESISSIMKAISNQDYALMDAQLINQLVLLGAFLSPTNNNIFPCIDFLREGYFILENLIPIKFLQDFSAYLLNLECAGWTRHKSYQAPGRHNLGSEGISTILHYQLNSFLSKLFNKDLVPSFSYLGFHYPGTTLKKHRDNLYRDISISILISHEPWRGRNSSWPLFICDHNDLEKAIRLIPGEGVMFEGIKNSHYRQTLTIADQVTCLFLQFCNSNSSFVRELII